jgi:hypothetical protein
MLRTAKTIGMVIAEKPNENECNLHNSFSYTDSNKIIEFENVNLMIRWLQETYPDGILVENPDDERYDSWDLVELI